MLKTVVHVFTLSFRFLVLKCSLGIVDSISAADAFQQHICGNIGLDCGLIIGSFVGSALISIICTKAMHWFHTPHHCLSIPSVIPMIPGVLMYRALFAIIDMHGVVGEVTVAMNNGIRASLIILFIAIGVAIPNIFVRRMMSPQREQRLMEMLKKRQEKAAAC